MASRRLMFLSTLSGVPRRMSLNGSLLSSSFSAKISLKTACTGAWHLGVSVFGSSPSLFLAISFTLQRTRWASFQTPVVSSIKAVISSRNFMHRMHLAITGCPLRFDTGQPKTVSAVDMDQCNRSTNLLLGLRHGARTDTSLFGWKNEDSLSHAQHSVWWSSKGTDGFFLRSAPPHPSQQPPHHRAPLWRPQRLPLS